MSDVKLTLEPELETPAPGIPTLTLDGVEEEKPVAPEFNATGIPFSKEIEISVATSGAFSGEIGRAHV